MDKNNKTSNKTIYVNKENSIKKNNSHNIDNNKFNKENNILRQNVNKWKAEKINIK